MTIKKPTFPAVSPQSVNRNIDKVLDKVKDLQAADGSVNTKALQDAVAGDGPARKNLDVVLDAFERYESGPDGTPTPGGNATRVYAGCAGGEAWQVLPEKLNQSQVSSVMNLLIDVKAKVNAGDKDQDGKIDQAEFQALRGSVSDIGHRREAALLHGALTDAPAKVKQFFRAQSDYESAQRAIAQRPHIAHQIATTADHHAATPTGAEALKWAYNAMMAKGSHHVADRLDRDAQGAEHSWTRFLPFSNVEKAEGHLNDDEIKSMLGVKDLAQFVDRTKARVTEAVGGDWQGWLNGDDVG